MNIGLAANDKYAQHLAVTIASVLVNAHPDSDIHFYVVTSDFSVESVERLRGMRTLRDFRLTVLYVDPSDFSDCRITRHTVVMYFRFRLPELLPSLKRLLYLDSDVIVRDSLRPLWETDLGDECLAACPDAMSILRRSQKDQQTFPVYYNSGVLLMNLEAMRADKSEVRLLTWIRNQTRNGSLSFPDQDAINAIYGKTILPLPIEWNYQYPLFDHDQLIPGSAKIVHFTTQNKPWKYISSSRFDYEYWKYLSLTPWKGALPEGRTADAILRRALRAFWRRCSRTEQRTRSRA